VDYVLDLRVGLSTFGKWEAAELNTDGRHAEFLVEGLWHAFLSLEEDTSVSYRVADICRPEREHAVNPMGQDLALESGRPGAGLTPSAKGEPARRFARAQVK
jgi:dTDP-4-dehydrorhamnose 3,5-epimerase